MNDFSIGGAWTNGFRFYGGHWPVHAGILILGALLSVGVEYAILGGRLVDSGATPSPMGGQLFEQPTGLLVMGLSYLFQIGSYFACWRLGFDGRRSVPGAVIFGLLAGLLAVLCMFLAYVVAAYIWVPLLTPDTVFVAILAFLLPLILVTSAFMVMTVVFIAAALILFLVFTMVYGAAMGQMGLAATVVGGSGTITVLLLVLSGVTFWLAARLSCVTSVMADRKSLNLFAAVAESWRLTWEEQWAITRYLALIGGALGLLLFGVSLAIGSSTSAMLPGTENPFTGTLGDVVGVAIAILFAFLAVAVPAGIYRQLIGEETPAEVFD